MKFGDLACRRKLISSDLLKRFGPLLGAILLMLLVREVHADYEDGLDAVFRGDYQTAYREFSAAAEEGLDLAQYNLAILYYMGNGVDQDMELAFKWTEAAAVQGHVDAQSNLGSLYLSGTGIDQNLSKGLEWLSLAGRGGHAGSSFSLANMYNDGEPTQRDEVLAHVWAAMAAAQEHPEAETLLARIERGLSGQELQQARRLYARWQIEPMPTISP